MPYTFVPISPMNPEFGPGPGEHCWYNINGVPNGDGGYTTFGELNQVTFGTAITSTATNVIRGTHSYEGAYATRTFLIADDSKIFENGTDRSDIAYGNTTAPWGMQFATYGPYVFATNRVDGIRYMDMSVAAVTPALNFADINTTASFPSTVAQPKASAICTYKNHVILGNIKMTSGYGGLPAGTYPSLVWWSGTDLPFYFGSPAPADSPAILGTDYRQTFDGDGEIVKLIATDSCVFIFKTGSIMRMDGPPFQISLVSGQHGTYHPMSVKLVGRKIFFVSQVGPAYVDIDSNQIVFIADGIIQRALCTGDGHLGFTMPPGPRSDATSYWGATSFFGETTSLPNRLRVSTGADYIAQRVVFHFAAEITVTGYGSTAAPSLLQGRLRSAATLLYDITLNEFTFLTPTAIDYPNVSYYQIVTDSLAHQSTTYYTSPLASITFVGLYDADGNGVRDSIAAWVPTSTSLRFKDGASSTYGHTVTIAWPFKLFSQIENGAMSMIKSVRPVWYSEWETDKSPTFKFRVYSTTSEGWGDWWGLGRCAVTDSSSSSSDGRYQLDTDWGKSHCIVMDVAAQDDTGSESWTTIRGLYGIIVEYAEGSSRSA